MFIAYRARSNARRILFKDRILPVVIIPAYFSYYHSAIVVDCECTVENIGNASIPRLEMNNELVRCHEGFVTVRSTGVRYVMRPELG